MTSTTLSSNDECDWFRLDCNEDGELKEIDFHDDSATIEDEQTLWNGKLPYEFTLLTTLEHFQIDDMQLRGNITDLFVNMAKLESVLLPGNKFTGALPRFGDQNPLIRHVDLSKNDFSGSIHTS